MKKISKEELKEVLRLHKLWLDKEPGGKRADLRGVDLRKADLRGADLKDANLREVNLKEADLRKADLSGSDLRKADLSGSDLRGAELEDANLRYTNLIRANLSDAKLPKFQIPQEGPLTVYKKLDYELIAKLRIPSKAKRTACLVSRKCRAESAKVLSIRGIDGTVHKEGFGWYVSTFKYKVGETVHPDSYNDDIRIDCAEGIHFFQTKEEAIEW